MTKDIIRDFTDRFPNSLILQDEPLKKYTSFKIGGPADIFVSPMNIEEFIDIYSYVQEQKLPYFILGNGSNILVSDKGIRGVVINMTRLNKLECKDSVLTAQCGVLLEDLTLKAKELSLTGLEFAYGIPGSVGGAVTMNAGAYGGEIKDCFKSAKLLSKSGEVVTMLSTDMNFGYRQSIIQTGDFIVLEATFELTKGNLNDITARMDELKEQRWLKQPMELPSGGSVFKRPEGHYTGKLVDDCDLRGYQIGGARISDKHCGFIVNQDNATANDVISLIKFTQATVLKGFGVTLERELRLVGEW